MNQPVAQGVSRQQSLSWILILVALATYVSGFLIFYPGVLVVTDEAYYVAQAAAFAHGHVYVSASVPFSSEQQRVLPSTYPPGTSLVQAPFVWAGGWRAASFASLLALIAVVLLLARWLQGARKPIWLALLFLLFPPVLVLSRVAMSDLPSAAIVLLALWLFWTGERRPWMWFAASTAAGASLLFRESNVLMFIPLFGFAILKRERGWPALIAGTATGVSLRLLVSHLLFGNAFFYRTPSYGFSLHAIRDNLWLYLFSLLVMVPGGLILAFAYRGRRRWPVITAIVLHLLFYLCYNYNAVESGRAKQLILAPRFFIPLLPLMIFAIAESAPRLWNEWSERLRPFTPPAIQRAATATFAVGLLAVCFGVHPAIAGFSRAQSSITQAIYTVTRDGAPVLTNPAETSKYISPVYGNRISLDYGSADPDYLNRLRPANGPAYIVLLQRTDSNFFRAATLNDEQFLARTQTSCTLQLLHDRWHDQQNRLRIWEVGDCRNPIQ